MVSLRQLCSDKGTSLCGRLHHNGSITHTRHNTVAADEIMLVRIRPGKEFGQQSALCQHVDGCFPVDIRIDAVQSVSKDSNGREMICQSGPMGMDIYPVSQSAYYQHIGTKNGQIAQEVGTELLAVIGGTACTYHIDDMQAVEIGVSFKEKYNRRIFTFTQARRVSLILQRQAGKTILLYKLHLLLGTQKGSGTIKSRHYPRIHTGHDFGELLPPTEYFGSTAHTLY